MIFRSRSRSRDLSVQIIASSFLIVFLLHLCHHVQGQSNNVASKLDFDDMEDKKNSSVSNQQGAGQQGRNNMNSNNDGDTRGGNRGRGNERGDDDSNSNRSGSSGSKSGPKIHGVRVTVDTGDTKKSKESKESVEITDLGKHKKRVGIHTDITFEITADGEDVLNATSSAQRERDEDASVPVFRGRGGHGHSQGSDSRHKTRKPYDPRTRWNPSFSAERRRGYDTTGRGSSAYYPHYPTYNVPVYKSSGDATRAAGGSIYRQDDGWNSYVPAATYWTTERPYAEHYRPNSVSGYQTGSGWKPCYCITYGSDNRRRRESNSAVSESDDVLRATSSVIQVVDSKVDKPFS